MTMTSSESQWIARVMHTISYVALMESYDILAEALQKTVGDDSRKRGAELHPILETGGPDNSHL